MKLSQIRLFIVLVDNAFNVSNTAEKVFMAQSSLSRQIQLFEDELEYPLFNRSGKRMLSLTPFGEKVYDYAIDLVAAQQSITELSRSWASRDVPFTIATTHTQAKYFLPKAIESFKKQLPQLQLRIEQSSPGNLISLLNKKQADIAICTEAIRESKQLNYVSCYQWKHGIVVPANHPILKLKTIGFADIAAYPIVTYVYGFTGRSTIQKAFKSINKKPQIILAASDSDVIKTYVKIGFGVGIIAETAYEQATDFGLIFRAIQSDIKPSETGIAWLKSKTIDATTQQAINIIAEHGKTFINQ